jgi:3'-phosphoadenosine 5'-phosphosulfate sulfotransferase (PAPS reductase)/FAD synthetase
MFYTHIINTLKKRTDKVILFHSATGKDSIMLCDLMSKNFTQVICIFMYIVKGLDYEKKYIDWAKRRYKNILFYETPHYALNSFIKNGYLGIKKNESVESMSIHKIDKLVKEKFKIDWSVYGFKKIDGVTRRLMLNGYPEGIYKNTHKVYPLMDLKNNDVLDYISDNDLIKPFNYGTKKPSSGCDISTPEFLMYIKQNYPEDLKKIFKAFPFCEANLFKYETYGKTTKAK